jgi:hypothetical protein
MLMRGPFDWQMTAELVNPEVLEILEKLVKVTLAFRGWVITLV